VVKETDAGIVVNGVRVLATLPIADEIAVYPARSHRLPAARRSVPPSHSPSVHTPGLEVPLPRKPGPRERASTTPWLRSRRWTPSVFDNVLIPWSGCSSSRRHLCNNMATSTGQFLHSVTSGYKNVVKSSSSRASLTHGPHSRVRRTAADRELLAELIENLEITKAPARRRGDAPITLGDH